MATLEKRGGITRRKLLASSGALAITPVLASLLAACSSQSPAPATSSGSGATSGQPAATTAPQKANPNVRFWHPTQTLGDMIVKEYQKTNGDLKLTFELGEFDTNTKTMATLAAGNPPDISYLGRWQGPDLAVRNAIYALDDRIKTAQSWQWSDVWKRLQTDSIQWGKTWVVPYATDTRAFFYNTTLMEQAGLDPSKPPTTWQELASQSVKATKKDSSGKVDTIGFTPTFGNPPTYLMFYSLLWMLGSDVVNADHTKAILTEKGGEALSMMKDLMDQQGGYQAATAFTKGLTLSQGIDAFSAGKVTFAMNGEWVFANWDKYSPNLKYGVIPGPVDPPQTEHFNYDGGGGWYYFKKGQNPDGAWKFTEFLMGHDFYTNYADQAGSIPALQTVAKDWAAKDKRRETFVATAATVHWIPIVVGTLDMLTFISTMWDDVLFGKSPADQAMKKAADGVQGILDKNNSYPTPEG